MKPWVKIAVWVLVLCAAWIVFDVVQGNDPIQAASDWVNGLSDSTPADTDDGDDGTGGTDVAIGFSENGLQTLMNLEGEPGGGPALTAYWDVDGYAIGYGSHTLPDGSAVQAGDTITSDEATSLLQTQTASIASWITANVSSSLTQNQMDALVPLVFNVGEGGAAKSLGDGGFFSQIASNAALTAQQVLTYFTSFSHSGGVLDSVLVGRNTLLANLFNTPDTGSLT